MDGATAWMGFPVYEEKRGVADTPGSYHRLAVSCTCHGRKAGSCKKTRAFSDRVGQKSGLGDMEPYAFLGAWLRARDRFDTAEAHKRFLPDADEVLAYAKERHWCPP